MTFRIAILALALGIAGFILAWGGWHAWVDHQRVDAIWELELRRAAQAQTPVK